MHSSHKQENFVFKSGYTLLPLILFTCLFVLFPAKMAIGQEDHPTPEKIIVGSGDSFRPMIYLDPEGNPVGMHVELWELWSSKTGIEVEFVLTDWNKVIPMLLKGKVDAVHGVSYTPERAEFLDFTESFEEFTTYIYYHESVGSIKNLGDLSGFPVGVLAGTNVAESIQKDSPEIKLVSYSNYEELVEAAIKGHIKVFLGDEPLVPFYFAKSGYKGGFIKTKESLFSSDIRVGVRKGNREALSIIEEGFSKISEEEKNRILKRWSGEELKWKIPLRWMLIAILTVGLVVAFLGIWNYSLRKLVAVATEEIRESEAKYRTLLRNAPVGIGVSSKDGRILEYNDTMLEIFGYSDHEADGLSLSEIYKDSNDRDRFLAELGKKGFVHGYETIYVRKDGTQLNVSLNAAPMNVGGRDVIFAAIDDISDRKKSEAELEKYRNQLEDLVDERTQELRDAQHKIITSERLAVLGQFSGSIAHEIRNPLAAISNAVYYLKKKIRDEDETVKSFLDIMDNRINDTARIIESILNLTKLEAPVKDAVPVEEISEYISKTVAAYENIDLDIEASGNGAVINIDREQFRIALKNILRNAAQAMPEGGRLVVRLDEISDNNCRQFKIEVSDSGQGIDAERLNRIFDPLFTTKSYGMGFGLAIVKMIVEKHGGSIGASSETGMGTTFTVLLPKDD